MMKPSPGTIGVSRAPSLGVAENAFPSRVHHAQITRIRRHRARPRPGPAGRHRGLPDPGLVRPGISGRRHLAGRAVRPDPPPPRVRVPLGQQALDRHRHEPRVPEVRVPVRERRIERLDDQVERPRRVVRDRAHVVSLENRQRLQGDRPLAPRAAPVHLVSAIGRANRRLHFDREFRHVLGGQQPALLLAEPRGALRDLALIEEVPRRPEAGVTARCSALRLGEHPEGAREILLHVALARLRRPAAAQQHLPRRGPLAHLVGDPRDVRREELVDRKPLLAQLDRGRRDLGKRHRPVAVQRGDPGVDRGRHDGGQDARRNVVAAPPQLLEGGGLRPPSQAADRRHLAGPRHAQHDRRDPADVGQVELQDIDAQPCRDAGVDGVAAALQDLGPGHTREIVPRGHHVV